jgi:hypothetical protein
MCCDENADQDSAGVVKLPDSDSEFYFLRARAVFNYVNKICIAWFRGKSAKK